MEWKCSRSVYNNSPEFVQKIPHFFSFWFATQSICPFCVNVFEIGEREETGAFTHCRKHSLSVSLSLSLSRSLSHFLSISSFLLFYFSLNHFLFFGCYSSSLLFRFSLSFIRDWNHLIFSFIFLIFTSSVYLVFK